METNYQHATIIHAAIWAGKKVLILPTIPGILAQYREGIELVSVSCVKHYYIFLCQTKVAKITQ